MNTFFIGQKVEILPNAHVTRFKGEAIIVEKGITVALYEFPLGTKWPYGYPSTYTEYTVEIRRGLWQTVYDFMLAPMDMTAEFSKVKP